MQTVGFRTLGLAGVLIVALGVVLTFGQDPPPPPAPVGMGDDVAASGTEVLTRGPIHEAFAQPTNTGGMDVLVVPNKPAEPLEEMPPTIKPENPRAVWIGGYWSWADERRDFIWVSGVWRVPPPNMQWVPGYWAQVPGGYQWTAGFWSPAAQPQTTYYPPPPPTRELGPTSDPPSPNYTWISGCWRWRDGQYAWQPGYWSVAREGWIWVPASYYWCPSGWVLCEGYWDYPLAGRGLLFAPCYIRPGVYYRPGYVFSPSVCIDGGLLTIHLFARPSYCHYYFGDYYGVEYDRLGIYPWFGARRYPGYVYDPLFTYYGWYYRGRDPRWQANLEGWHTYYRGHPDARPPHDMAAQIRLGVGGRPGGNFISIGVTFDVMRNNPRGGVRVVEVSAAERGRIHETARESRGREAQRHEAERRGAGGAARGPRTMALNKGPQGAGHGVGPAAGARGFTPARGPAPAPKPTGKTPPKKSDRDRDR